MNLSRTTLGYCTNVHPGTTLAAIQENLTRHALPIRDQLQRKQLLGVGLWVPRQASDELVRDARRCAQFRDWLADHDLKPYTINGFPYDNFHQPVVKHAVYLPTWWQRERLEYTKQLVTILDHWLPPGETGSISTMPIAWGSPAPSQEQLAAAARHLQQLADYLDDLETRTGRRIVIAIEPEPGCYLQTTEGLVRFFDRYLQLDQHRRYLTVCHDVCHADVMNESQAACMSAYRDAQIGVGKIQVSAAIEVDWQALTSDHDRRKLCDNWLALLKTVTCIKRAA